MESASNGRSSTRCSACGGRAATIRVEELLGNPIAYREGPLQYEAAVYCRCKKKAPRWISNSIMIPGSRYYACINRRRSGGCGATMMWSSMTLTSVWVSIDNPCNVRLTGKTISALFCDNSEMTEDTMTAIMCVLNEFDETLDSFSNHQHWRTFLPALSLGAADENYSTCLMQLPSNWTQCVDSLSQITPVSLNAMVFVPILIRGYWHCFALNIKYKHVHVQMAVSESGNYIVHEKNIKEISVILLNYLFEKTNRGGLDHAANLEDWQFKFAHVESLETIGNNGFATCLYALLFDGTNFRDDILSTLNSRKTRRRAEEIVNVEKESDAKATLFSLLLDRQENPLKLSDLLPHLPEATA